MCTKSLVVLGMVAGLAMVAVSPLREAYADGVATDAKSSPSTVDSARGSLDTRAVDVAPPSAASRRTILNISPERLGMATGHYARARSLLAAAVREFDAAVKLGSPDMIIDSKAWRAEILDRAEDLDRVLDPQPRVNKGGVHFKADTRLLNEATR